MSAYNNPYPSSPATSDQLISLPIRSNFQAIAAYLNAMDGGNLQAGTVTEPALAVSVNPRQRAADAGWNFVSSGLTITGTATTANIAAGVYYVNGYRINYLGGTISLTASDDNYVDLDQSGVVHVSVVANSGTSPSLFANSIRIGIVTTNGSNNVVVINQGSTSATAPVVSGSTLTVCDSLGNLIYPTAPSPGLIGYRQITGVFTLSASQTTATEITGLHVPCIVPAGRKVKVTVFAYTLTGTAGDVASLEINSGSVSGFTNIIQGADVPISSSGGGYPGSVTTTLSPATGSNTFIASIRCSAAHNVAVVASASAPLRPAFISVELV